MTPFSLLACDYLRAAGPGIEPAPAQLVMDTPVDKIQMFNMCKAFCLFVTRAQVTVAVSSLTKVLLDRLGQLGLTSPGQIAQVPPVYHSEVTPPGRGPV